MRSKRGTDKYVVELLIAVDPGMVEYYGVELDDVVKSSAYLFSDIYQNSNLKQSISVSLVDIIRLPFDPTVGVDVPGTDGGKSGEKMHKTFCEFMKTSSIMKYDAAMLITRYWVNSFWCRFLN